MVTRTAALIGGLAMTFASGISRAADQPPAQSIMLASTTSVDNSGLLGHILPIFTKETGIAIRFVPSADEALHRLARGRMPDRRSSALLPLIPA